MRARTGRQPVLISIVLGVLPPGFLLADTALDQYTVAATHYARHQWDLATTDLAEFIARYPRHARAVRAHFYRGEALMQLHRFDEARREFRTVLDQNPSGPLARRSLFRSGEAACLSGKTSAAKVDFERFEKIYPDDPLEVYLLSYLGGLALKDHHAERAERIYRRALRQFSDGPLRGKYVLGLAIALASRGHTDEALSLYGTLTDHHDKTLAAEAVLREGRLCRQAGRYAEALKAWAVFRARFPDSTLRPMAAMERGRTLYRLRRYADAARQFIELKDRLRVGVEAQYWLGRTRQAQGRWRTAAVTFAAAAKAHPHHPRAPSLWALAGSSLLQGGDAAGALRQFDHGLAADYAQSQWADDCLLGRLQALLAAGRLDELDAGIAAFDRRFPNSPLRHQVDLLGTAALMARGRFAAATKSLRALLEQDIGDRSAAYCQAELAVCHARLKQFDAARESYQALLARHPCRKVVVPATVQLAQAAQAAGAPRWAATLFQRLADDVDHPDLVAEGLYGLAWSCVKANQMDQAVAAFSRLVRDFPDDPRAPEATYVLAKIARDEGGLARAASLLDKLTGRDDHGNTATGEVLARALYLQALVAADRQAWDQVAASINQLISRFPDHPLQSSAKFWIAEAAYRRGMLEDARTRFDKLAKETRGRHEPWLATVLLRRAQIRAHQHQWNEALDIARGIVQEFPNYKHQYEVDYLIGRCQAGRGELAAARASYARVLLVPAARHTETAAMARWMIGETYMHQQRYDEAIRAFGRAEILCAYPEWQARSLVEMAKCHELQGQPEQAAKIYRTLREKYPTTTAAKQADTKPCGNVRQAASHISRAKR